MYIWSDVLRKRRAVEDEEQPWPLKARTSYMVKDHDPWEKLQPQDRWQKERVSFKRLN